MDDTPLDRLLRDLDAADPADAPDVAARIADELTRRLDESTGDGEPEDDTAASET